MEQGTPLNDYLLGWKYHSKTFLGLEILKKKKKSSLKRRHLLAYYRIDLDSG